MSGFIICIICASLVLAVPAVIWNKAYAEEKAIRKVANSFPEVGIYWNAKVDAANKLQAIDKEKKALRANIDERKYFPDDNQYVDTLKESYYKACLKEKEYEKEVKKAIQQIHDYEKAHFGEEKGYYWPLFFEE